MRKRLTIRAREEAGQLRLLPSAAELRRLKQARAAGEQVQCWNCRAYKPIDQVRDHLETGMSVCVTCWDTHPARYEAWLTRKIASEEKGQGA